MIQIGSKAPDFSNITSFCKGCGNDFPKVSLSDYKGKWLVFFFYPRDFTFICPTELKGFSNAQGEFEKLGAKVLAASTDSAWSHKAWFERDLPDVTYSVLADTNLQVARDYQVLNESNGDAERGLFIIDPEGMVKYIVVSAGSVGRSVSETLRVLEALQSGELCPMEWHPGEKTLGKA
jgi:peroxiredoxin 2/4